MQKFGLLFLAVSTALLGLVIPVEGVALVDRETNAERFARGLPPKPPNRREVAQRAQPSRRDSTPIEGRALMPALELRSTPSRRAVSPEVVKRSTPSRRADSPTVEKRTGPSKRADMTVERRAGPSKRADATVQRRAGPSKRADRTVEKRTGPSKRADTTVHRRAGPSKRADATVQRRAGPSKRADTTVQRRAGPSKRADATVQRRAGPSKRADVTVERRAGPSKHADRTVERRAGPSKRADRTVERRTGPSKRADATVEKRAGPSRRATSGSVERRAPQPSRRATEVEKRTQPSKRAEAEVFHAPHSQLSSGRLEVRWAHNNSIAGHVANNPTGGSFGLNTVMCHGEDDLYVEYFDSNLMVMNAEFPPPYFVGGGDAESAVHDCSDKIRFGTVELGSSSAVWTVDPMSGELTATLVNQDGSVDEPSLVYDPVHNVLSFTHDVNRNPTTEHAVNLYLSD